MFSSLFKKSINESKKKHSKQRSKISFDEIEELLVLSDIEYEIVQKAMDGLPSSITKKQLRHRLIMLFEHTTNMKIEEPETIPCVELIVGVNGAGKTTTIAKLAYMHKANGKKVLLGAGDTFRAAAIEQLTIWSNKLDVPIIKTKKGHDASAVAFDSIKSGIAKEVDYVIIDTAGRLQTQTGLVNELKKIVKICNKALAGAPHKKLMIIDGTQGNAAVAQAKSFRESIDIDAVIVTKLDGTAKGGALFSISNRLELPILYIGTGEKQEDLMRFDPDSFVDDILEELYTEK